MFDDRRGELAGIRILVAEDQADTLETLEAFFEMFGIQVIAAASGNQAYALFREHRPDAIVSDLWMPDGTGLELVRRVRALDPSSGGLTPAISVSGGAKPEDSFDAGFHFHFTKPVDPLVLLDAVRDFVRAGRPGRARWTASLEEGDVVLRLDGHVTGADMRAAAGAVAGLLDRSTTGRVVSDLRGLTGLDPSVGAAAQREMWPVRRKVKRVVVVGGSFLARAISRSCCLILGIACDFADSLPR